MVIQSSSAVSATSQISASSSQRQTIADTPATTSESVTISQAARDALASDSNSNPDPQVKHSWYSNIVASTDQKSAEQYVYDMAYVPDGPLVSLADPDHPRYVATGELVTPQSEAYFQSLSPQIRAGRIAIYEAEKAKGSSPVEIMDKIADFMETQPRQYLDMMHWKSST